jgi:hypothetical protein
LADSEEEVVALSLRIPMEQTTQEGAEAVCLLGQWSLPQAKVLP